ncbi:MAG: rod shape-determining protein MreD [Streptosporangiaceae bacterium]
MRRKVLAALALAAALMVQLTIINGLALPGGGTPDLVLLCVIGIGMTGGPATGVIAGFWAGLTLDLAPPASQLVGQYALVLCLIGYGSGRLRFVLRHSAMLAVAAAVAMAAIGEALAAVLTLALDTPEVTGSTVAQVLPPTLLFDAALAPFILLCSVRLAIAMGVSFDPQDDSPALETGGSAAPVALAGATSVPGIAGMNAAVQLQRARHRRAAGDGRAAVSGRWLVGDVDTPAMGSIGWLSGPATTRRARREQAQLTATVIGVTPRKGAVWVGRRPPGLHLLTPAAPQKTRRMARLRVGAGAAGSAAARPGPPYHVQFGRPVRLGLADEQRRRARAANSHARAKGHVVYGANRHGLDRHGMNGPAVPRITFGTASAGGSPGHGPTSLARRPAHGRPHRIAFGTGSLPGAGRAAGRPIPRIAFGTSSLGSAGAGSIGTGQSSAGRGGLIGVGGAAIRCSHGGRKPKQPQFARVVAHRPAKARRPKQPRFARVVARPPAKARQPKTARISTRHGVFGGPRWLRRPGGRSTVWRVGSRRMSGFG